MNVLVSILWVILWIIAGLVGLLLFFILLAVVLIAIPVKYSVDASTGEKTSVLVRASYLFNFVRFTYENNDGTGKNELRIAGFRIKEKKEKKDSAQGRKDSAQESGRAEKTQKSPKAQKTKAHKKPKTPPPKKEISFNKLSKSYAVLTDSQGKTMIKLTFIAFKKILRVMLPKHVEIWGVVGFSSPATTGIFMGAYEALAGMSGLRSKIRLAGDFNSDSTTIRLNAKVKGSVSVFRMTLPFIWLATRKPVRKLIRNALK
ncbi:MAG: hypothetical protein FWF79_03335 [Defluviitaleaceae bacterium]|nr:hypothetical protein [Defluviitaleaceae bacterium]